MLSARTSITLPRPLESRISDVHGPDGIPGYKQRYQKRKVSGICAYFGCAAVPEVRRLYCLHHLRRMAQVNRTRVKSRKSKRLCVYCGARPQFWGVRCILCRQKFVRSPLPFGARKALRLYRSAETQLELDLLQAHARFSIRKLLLAGDINGARARALMLYAGLDNGEWRTYSEVAELMGLSKERVRQLLQHSKTALARIMGNNVPWKRVRA
jgi:hypothetical protein